MSTFTLGIFKYTPVALFLAAEIFPRCDGIFYQFLSLLGREARASLKSVSQRVHLLTLYYTYTPLSVQLCL